MSSSLVRRAAILAKRAHEGQLRKYTGQPYIVHPANVAMLVKKAGGTDEMQAAAWCHDVVEDCAGGFKRYPCRADAYNDIEAQCGVVVRDLVAWLTDQSTPENGNREARKAVDRRHIACGPAAAQTIKLADLIDNSHSILARDLLFAKTYIPEKRRLLEVLTRGDRKLYLEAETICQRAWMEHRI